LGQIDFGKVREYAFMDQYRYVAMAQHPFGPQALVHEPPFCWRLLAPLIVHVMPMSAIAGFWWLTVLSLIGATLALMWFLRGLGLPRGATVAGGSAFVLLTYVSGFTLWDYMLVDPLAIALLTLTMACAVHRRGPLLVLTLLALAVTKETALLGGLFGLVWAWEHRDARMVRWASAGLAAAALVFVAIHVVVPADQPYNVLTQLRLWSGIRHNSLAYFESRASASMVDAWSVLLPLAALQLLHAPRVWRMRSFIILLAGAYAQMFIASDVQRLVVYASPVVIAACAFEVEYLARWSTISRWWFWGPTLLLEAVWWLGTYATWYRAVRTPLVLVLIGHSIWVVLLIECAFAGAIGVRWLSQRRAPHNVVE
jgi:hypothetical protein